MSAKEQSIINALSNEFRKISGIKHAYDFAQNPDNLSNAQLPAVCFFPGEFKSSLKGHHNHHRNEFDIVAILFVAPVQDMGGRIKFLENEAMPFMFKVRNHFQQESAITTLHQQNLVQVNLFSGQYGAGGPLLTYNGIEHIGIVFRWTFIEIT